MGDYAWLLRGPRHGRLGSRDWGSDSSMTSDSARGSNFSAAWAAPTANNKVESMANKSLGCPFMSPPYYAPKKSRLSSRLPFVRRGTTLRKVVFAFLGARWGGDWTRGWGLFHVWVLGLLLGVSPVQGEPMKLPLATVFPGSQLDGETYIWAIQPTPGGQVVASGQRLAFYEGNQWRFVTNFTRSAIRGLLVDGDVLWVSSRGELGSFRLPLTETSPYQKLEVPDLTEAGDIWEIRKSGKKIVAVSTEYLWTVDPGSKEVDKVHLPNNSRLMVQDWDDRLLVVDGTSLWEIQDGKLSPFKNPLPDPTDTAWHGSDGTYVLTAKALYRRDPTGWERIAWLKDFSADALITSVVRWGDLVVAATFSHGLAVYDLKSGALQVWARSVGQESPNFLCSKVDGSDRLWLGRRNGILLYESLRYGHTLEVTGIPVLAGRDRGLVLGFNDRWEYWPEGGERIQGPNRPWSFNATRRGPLIGFWAEVWVEGGIVKTDGNIVDSSVELPNGDLIVASGDRLYRVKAGTHTAELEPQDRGIEVSSLAVRGQTVWASGPAGELYRASLDRSLKFLYVTNLPHTKETSIRILQTNLVFASSEGVVYGLDFRPVVQAERLRQAQLAENADGLWLLGEQDGIRRLGKLQVIQGVVTWETVEAKGISQLGELQSFHGSGHLLTFCAGSTVMELRSDQLRPKYRLSSPKLAFSFRNSKGQVVSSPSVPRELSAEENGLALVGRADADEFSERPQFERRLRPSETQWLPAKVGETVSYPSLSPRDYILEVRSTHLGHAGEVVTYPFTVLPPWYATGPATLAYFALAGMSFYGWYRYRTHTLHRRTAELERTVQDRTRALFQASAAKSEFLAAMSHEIRNPMNGVIGLVESLQDQPHSPRQAYTLRMLQNCADQLRTTVDDILDFSKIEAGKVELESVEFDLRDTLEAAAVTVDLDRDKIRFVDPPERGIRLVGDLGKLRQIFANYLNNALKYGVPPGARVMTLLTPVEGGLRLTLSVTSFGPTIPKETLDTFFDSFSRGNEAMERNIRGTGLGLAICRRYAAAMGGEVGAVSANGETTFYLNIPFAQAPTEVLTIKSAPTPNGLPARALAIEDEDYNRIVLGNILAKMNYSVDWATTGAEALKLAQENGYDIIFTDYRLPDTNGVELARRILAQCSDPTPAVFAVTAYSTKERRDECLKAGMSGFISKPITLEKLRTTLAAWAEGKLPTISLETSQPKTPPPVAAAPVVPPTVPAAPTPEPPAPALKPADELVAGWNELLGLIRTEPKKAVFVAHRLNNLCRALGLIDAAEQLELLEGALERGEPSEALVKASEAFLSDYCNLDTVVKPWRKA